MLLDVASGSKLLPVDELVENAALSLTSENADKTSRSRGAAAFVGEAGRLSERTCSTLSHNPEITEAKQIRNLDRNWILKKKGNKNQRQRSSILLINDFCIRAILFVSTGIILETSWINFLLWLLILNRSSIDSYRCSRSLAATIT